MSIVSVKLNNIKKHKNLFLQMNGRNVAFVGDTRKGKTTVLQIIQASLGIIDYPKDALTIGETEADSEVVYMDDVTGKQYTVKRKATRGKFQRFDIKTPEFSRSLNWEDEMKSLFNGVDPKVSYFDYGKYFFKEKTADGRFEYAMKCTLGDLYITNFKRIEELEEARAAFGKEKKILESRLIGTELMSGEDIPANYELLKAKYENPITTEKAVANRDMGLQKRPNVKELQDKLTVVKEHNEKCRQLVVQRNNIIEKEIPNATSEILVLSKQRDALRPLFNQAYWNDLEMVANEEEEFPGEMHPIVKELLMKASSFYKEFHNLNDRIEELNADLLFMEDSVRELDRVLTVDPLRAEEEFRLQMEYDNAEIKTGKIERVVQQWYDRALNNIGTFNQKRSAFQVQKRDYDALQEAQDNWIKKDNEIKDIELENVQAFKKAVPFEGLEIRDIIATKKIKGEEVETVLHHLYYNGLELNYANVSKGESIQIAVHFQAVHSPRLRLIFIPEAQSLGSDFDELAAAASEHGFQWIAEFTERGKEFEMRFEEEIIKEK